MTRSLLARWMRRLALTALPIGACNSPVTPPPDALLVDGGDDGTDDADVLPPCASDHPKCGRYIILVDGGPDPTIMPADCLPCGFVGANGMMGNYCSIEDHRCGREFVCKPECVGRRPAGLVEPSLMMSDKMAEWLARAAHLEAASVPAFARLRDELTMHGAPERLIAGARRAMLDEIRHARMMTDLARAAGARVPLVDAPPEPERTRPLVEIALENGVEGCVRETLGAHAALQQTGQTSARPIMSDTFRRIAIDEARHAALAWAVDAWLTPQLTDGENARVNEAMRRALREIAA